MACEHCDACGGRGNAWTREQEVAAIVIEIAEQCAVIVDLCSYAHPGNVHERTWNEALHVAAERIRRAYGKTNAEVDAMYEEGKGKE
jgi:hypothetical protein